MLRDNLAGLIEPMLSGAGAYPLALRTNRKQSSDDRPPCLENPRPAGAESTLTENVASPFHAEPGHHSVRRHKSEHPFDTPCRTARRNENWVIPSLSRATPSATSEH